MNLKKSYKALIIVLVAVLALGAVLPAFADSGGIDDYFDDLDSIREQLEQMKKNRNKTASELDRLRSLLDALDRDMYKTEQELDSLARKISQLEEEIAVQEERIADVEASIAETEERLAVQVGYLEQRLCAMYKNGAVSYLEVLFSASSFSDFLSRFGFLQRLIESDTELVAEIEGTKASLQVNRDILAAELGRQLLRREELEASQVKAEGKRAYLRAQASLQEELKDEVQAELNKQNKGIASLEADMKAIEAEIKRLLELERVRAGDPPSFFTWPVAGFDRIPYNITSDFGWRTHPITGLRNYHPGVDIARLNRQGQSIGGRPILAAASGTVDFVRSYDGGGYGIYVIVSHGGGYQTLYAHMRKATVKVGDVVTMGQQIGIVGTTGSSTGNHLHFEVWVMGEKKNPLGFEYK